MKSANLLISGFSSLSFSFLAGEEEEEEEAEGEKVAARYKGNCFFSGVRGENSLLLATDEPLARVLRVVLARVSFFGSFNFPFITRVRTHLRRRTLWVRKFFFPCHTPAWKSVLFCGVWCFCFGEGSSGERGMVFSYRLRIPSLACLCALLLRLSNRFSIPRMVVKTFRRLSWFYAVYGGRKRG